MDGACQHRMVVRSVRRLAIQAAMPPHSGHRAERAGIGHQQHIIMQRSAASCRMQRFRNLSPQLAEILRISGYGINS